MSQNSMIGQLAPAFTGIDQNGASIHLSDFLGKYVALYFYPRDMTPTCTVQACNLRDNYSLLQKHDIQIIGVSADDVAKHKKFETKHQLPFPLIADTSTAIAQQYDVWKEKKFMGKTFMGILRTTFIIDKNGYIVHIFDKPKSKEHASEILQIIESIN